MAAFAAVVSLSVWGIWKQVPGMKGTAFFIDRRNIYREVESMC